MPLGEMLGFEKMSEDLRGHARKDLVERARKKSSLEGFKDT